MIYLPILAITVTVMSACIAHMMAPLVSIVPAIRVAFFIAAPYAYNFRLV